MAKFNNSGIYACLFACALATLVMFTGCSNDEYWSSTSNGTHGVYTVGDHNAIQEMNENIGEIRNSIDNNYIICQTCGAHVHDWWYIHYEGEELEVCQFCYQDMK